MSGEDEHRRKPGSQGGGGGGAWKLVVALNRTLTLLSYPVGACFMAFNHWEATQANARAYWVLCLAMWLPVSGIVHSSIWSGAWALVLRLSAHALVFLGWDLGMFWFTICGLCVDTVLKQKECKNRLFNRPEGTEEFKGSKIVVLGNGPSLASGDPFGAAIDSMDEVVRFNNFQTKASGLDAWTGSKTTVHFSDSMLYPSYPEYAVPEACKVLSLFMDRLMIAGSYFLFRMAIDLAPFDCWRMMSSPELGWIPTDNIRRLKRTLEIGSKWRHPTSGLLAIDWFVHHRPDPKVPVYIHGFDFFEGSSVHYYSKTEPLYEHLNDLLGVNMMHEPQREKSYVEAMIKEGKVKWLKDAVADGDVGTEVKAAIASASARAASGRAPATPAKDAAGVETAASRLWPYIVELNRLLSVISYPIGIPLVCLNFSPSTAPNARLFRYAIVALWLPATYAFHVHLASVLLYGSSRLIAYFLFFWAVDVPCFWASIAFYGLEQVLNRKQSTNRLFSGEKPDMKGKNIVILGNGPSLAKGTPHGELIDSMDEVIRFNNFQTRMSGLEAWTGSKTTVHFSDSMLYPSYPEYRVPGACVCLSLFMDRLIISVSYFMFRYVADLAAFEAWRVLRDPALGWISAADIHNLKKEIGIEKWKHPTSGCLAIDWFVRHRPDPSVPVYIHGFDFFQGDQVHYYSKSEPLYERLNDLLGVTVMHEPQKERAFVERLVKEGKAMWLDGLPAQK